MFAVLTRAWLGFDGALERHLTERVSRSEGWSGTAQW